MAENILKLRVDSAEYDSKIQRAASGLQHFVKACHDQGDVIGRVVGETKKYIQSIGNMETVAKNSKGKLNELTAAYTEIRMVYKNLSDEEKRAPFGKELNKQLEIMKGRIDTLKKDLNDVNKELNPSVTSGGLNTQLGDLNGILSQVGGQLGINTSMLSGLTAGTMGYAAAVAAVVKVEYEAVKAFKEYNDELARQSQITTVTTGLNGGDADNMTAAARSIAKVYGTDFREVINAANTLMTQFGKSGDEAIQLIRDGMQGMIMGDGGKLLNMIKQYAPSFRDAGIEASQLIAIIHNSEGGLFTDENMNAIVMGIKNIRLMTKATNDALKQIGVNGDDITKRLNDGTMTIFEAIGKVSDALQNVQSGGQDAGQVMQQVFGRQGTAAGTNLAKAIATLNTKLDETKTNTGQLGDSFARLEQANEKLEKAMMKTFEVKGWDEMWNIIETNVISTFADVVDILGDINHAIDSVGVTFEDTFGGGGAVAQALTDFVVALTGPLGLIKEMVKYTKMLTGAGQNPNEFKNKKSEEIYKQYIGDIEGAQDKTSGYSAARAAVLKRANAAYRRWKNGETASDRRGGKNAYEIYREVLQRIDEYMDSYFDQIGKTESTVKPETKPLKPQKIVEKDVKEKSIDDIINEQYPDISQAESVGKSYGEQITEGILVGMAEKAQRADMNTLKNMMEVVIKNGIEGVDIPADELMSNIIGDGADIPDETWQKLQDKINAKLEELGIEPIKIDFSTGNVSNKVGKKTGGNDLDKFNKEYSKIVGGVSSIASGIQQMGIEMPKELQNILGVLTGISSIMSGITALLALIQIDTKATAVSTTADALLPLANGGVVHAADGYMVPGNTYSGDMIPAALNAGEVVLNRAQAGILASDITSNGARNINVSGRLEGETIVLAADRWGKRTGKGELVFWKQ